MIKNGIVIINILFITAVAYFSVDTGYGLLLARIELPTPVKTTPEKVLSAKEREKQPYANYRTIVTRNLFNSKTGVPEKKPAKDVKLEELSQTKLRLKLWGTVIGNDEETFAVIELEKKRKQNLYKIGDAIETASIKMILREKVVLTVDGKDEILEMEKPVSKSRPQKRSGATGAIAGGTPRQKVSKQRITLNRAHIDSALGNLNELMEQAQIKPHSVDGQQEGLILSRVKPNSLFRRMGLRNGDIITGVNGSAIESVDDALKLYEDLKTAEGTTVEITRRGRKRQIEYKIKE